MSTVEASGSAHQQGAYDTRHWARILAALERHGSLSRTELAESTGLSRSTISRQVANLMTCGLLAEESSRIPTGGRGQIPIILNPYYGYLALVQVESDRIMVGCYGFDLTVRADEVQIGLDASGDAADQVISAISGFSAAMRHDGTASTLRAVGVLYRGGHHPGGTSRDGLVRPNWESVWQGGQTLGRLLEKRLHVPVTEHDEDSCVERGIALRTRGVAKDNHGLISLGERVLLSVVQAGSPVEFRDGARADITRQIMCEGSDVALVADHLVTALSLLESLFCIEVLYLVVHDSYASSGTRLVDALRLPGKSLESSLVPIDLSTAGLADAMVGEVRNLAMGISVDSRLGWAGST